MQDKNLQTDAVFEDVDRLRQELAVLRSEKADLEVLLETITEHSDVVEQTLHEEVQTTLQESEKRFRLILEANPVPVLISAGHDGKILYANASVGHVLGFSRQALLGR